MVPWIFPVWDFTLLPLSPCRTDWRSEYMNRSAAVCRNCTHRMNKTPELNLENQGSHTPQPVTISIRLNSYFKCKTHFFSRFKSRFFEVRRSSASLICKHGHQTVNYFTRTLYFIRNSFTLPTMISRALLMEEDFSWCSGSRLTSTATSNESSDWTDAVTSQCTLYFMQRSVQSVTLIFFFYIILQLKHHW